MAPHRQKVWFVTGASRGLGNAICAAAADRGDHVVATARDPAALNTFARAHPETLVLPLDVTDADAARAAAQAAVDHFGRIDVVVNNAGYGHVGAVEELTDAEMRGQYEVNLFGVLNVTRAVLPHMRRRRSGHLVQMSSLNGVVGLAGGGHYAATKFAVEGLSESLAEEVEPLGIRVTIVEPGPYRTGFAGAGARHARPIDDYAPTAGAAREAIAELDGNQPGDPHDAARAILEAVDAAESPLRLPLDDIARDGIRGKLTAQLAELEPASAAAAR
jgi:NAD(P)-dependent dehydrogenase (short-subunit alcohol dehydrogenase family)